MMDVAPTAALLYMFLLIIFLVSLLILLLITHLDFISSLKFVLIGIIY